MVNTAESARFGIRDNIDDKRLIFKNRRMCEYRTSLRPSHLASYKVRLYADVFTLSMAGTAITLFRRAIPARRFPWGFCPYFIDGLHYVCKSSPEKIDLGTSARKTALQSVPCATLRLILGDMIHHHDGAGQWSAVTADNFKPSFVILMSFISSANTSRIFSLPPPRA